MIAIGCDHAGYEMKLAVIKFLAEKGIEFRDVGCNGETCDYPAVAVDLCEKLMDGSCATGILVCGTGLGMSIAANKFIGVRAAVCTNEFTAKHARLHNKANIMCIGSRVIDNELAIKLTDIFIHTDFEGGRHKKRLAMIDNIENIIVPSMPVSEFMQPTDTEILKRR